MAHGPGFLPVSDVCMREECDLPSEFTPVFYVCPSTDPSKDSDVAKPPQVTYTTMGLCKKHRDEFIEREALGALEALVESVGEAGVEADLMASRWEMVEVRHD